MTNPYSYLELTDGTDQVVIWNGAGTATPFLLDDGWAPVVAGLRRSALMGFGRYAEAVEEMTLNIIGATASEAYANLSKLVRLMDRTERARINQTLNTTLIKYAPRGSTLFSPSVPAYSQILGRAAGDETAGVTLSARFNRSGNYYVVEGVRLRFERIGMWVKWGTESASSSAATNGDLATIAMPSSCEIPSPMQINISSVQIGNYIHNMFVALTRVDGGIVIVNAEDGAAATDYSSFNDSANNARNTNVLRFTPTATSERISAAISISIPLTTRRMAIYANVRNNSASTSFRLRVRFSTTAYVEAFTPVKVIPPYSGSAYPEWQFLGIVPAYFGGALTPSVTVYLQASAASGTLDIDSIVLIDVSDEDQSQIIRIDKNTLSAYSGGVTQNLFIDHRLFSARTPQVLANNGYEASYQGSPIFMFGDATLYGLLMMTGSDSSPGNSWRGYRGALYSNTWTLYRSKAYLAPS